MRAKSRILAVLGVLCLSFCGSDSEIRELLWETTGGGDALFRVLRADGEYNVQVQRYYFQDVNVSRTLTTAYGDTYRLVDDIFGGRRDVRDDTTSAGGLTGTWTSITLAYADGSRTTIDNIDTTGDLRRLYDFAVDDLPEASSAADAQ